MDVVVAVADERPVEVDLEVDWLAEEKFVDEDVLV